jgi:hypothetical protein
MLISSDAWTQPYVLVDPVGTSGAGELHTVFTREPCIPRDVPPMQFMLPDGERAHFGAASLTLVALLSQATKIQLLGARPVWVL